MKVFLFLSLICLQDVLSSRFRLGEVPPPPPDKDVRDPEDQWFTQILDHYNPLDERVWDQRFWANWDNYVEGGPVFLKIGGEAEANPRWMNYGAWFDWAQHHGAAMFYLEHRYYGESKPTEDLSRENMKYLSSRQGLEDLATFITAMNSNYNLTSAPWISFGGSYPGSMSAWLRMRFPHLVSGAVSSSGPLFAKLDFLEYLGVVEDALDTTGPGCNIAITEALAAVDTLVESMDGWIDLTTMFKLCEPFNGSNEMDVKSFIELLIDNLAGIVQYNGRYSEDIFSICAIMTDEEVGSPLERLAAVNDVMLEMNQDECSDHTYDAYLELLSDTTWPAVGGVGRRQWTWQTCTEFGWYQTTNQESSVYGRRLGLEFFERWCQDAFGSDFTHEHLENLIAASNIEYGGFQPQVDNVVFVHGSIDPWHAMGVLEDLSETAPSIYITGTSHCADMYPDSPSDNEELRMAKIKIGQFIDSWINGM